MKSDRPAGSLDAPPGRYRVVEKDGRLVVVDNRSGTAVPPTLRLRAQAKDAPTLPRAAGANALDRAGAFMVRLVVRQWDEEGRAVIHWRWSRPNGKPYYWNGRMDAAQQRRLGRALLALAAVPLLLLIGAFATGLPFIGFLAGLPLLFYGTTRLNKLRGEGEEGPAE